MAVQHGGGRIAIVPTGTCIQRILTGVCQPAVVIS